MARRRRRGEVEGQLGLDLWDDDEPPANRSAGETEVGQPPADVGREVTSTRLIEEKVEVVATMDQKAVEYARVAEAYWRTYLPSRYAKIPEDQRQAFFTELGRQVSDQVTFLATDNLRASSRPTDQPLLRERRAKMAQLRAEEEALAELVYLPKVPGTEDREMPRIPPGPGTGSRLVTVAAWSRWRPVFRTQTVADQGDALADRIPTHRPCFDGSIRRLVWVVTRFAGRPDGPGYGLCSSGVGPCPVWARQLPVAGQVWTGWISTQKRSPAR